MQKEKKEEEEPPIYDPARKEDFERFKEQMQEQMKIQKTIKKIHHKIVIMSGKGGVGKTTVAVNLAVALTKRKFKVGLIDFDMTGPDVPLMLGLEDVILESDGKVIYPAQAEGGLKVVSLELLLEKKDTPVIWRGPVKIGAMKQFIADVDWGELDYLIMDLPPGTSDEPLSVAQMIPDADGAIVITTPQDVSVLDISKSVNFAKMVKMPVLGIVENMSGLKCPHCKKDIQLFGSGGGEAAAKKYDVPFLGKVPMDPEAVGLGDKGKPFIDALPDSDVSKAFVSIVDKLIKLIDKKDGKKR
jgi:Mrp family chromosome partitioning ATPase